MNTMTSEHAIDPARASVGVARLAIVIAATALGLSVGFAGLYFATLSVFLKPLAVGFGWTRAQTGSLTSAAFLGLAIGSPLIGALIDRVGPRRLIGCSILLFAFAIFAQTLLPPAFLSFLLVSFTIGLIGAGTGPAGYLSALLRFFDRRLGLALSFAMAGSGVGASVLPIVAQHAINIMGWRGAYRLLAVIALIVGLVAWKFIPAQPLAKPGAVRKTPPISGDTRGVAFRDRRFWTLAFVILVATGGGLGAMLHLAALLTDRGMTAIDAAGIAAFSGVGLFIGRFAAGLVMDIVFAPLVAATGLILGAIGLLGIAYGVAAPFPVLAACSMLFGLALGTEGDFAAFAVRRYFGMRAFGAIYGSVMAVYSLGGILGPILFGIGFDVLGSYKLVMTIAAIGYVLAATAVLTLGRYRWLERDAPTSTLHLEILT